jgi:protein-tyrosine phosphatase
VKKPAIIEILPYLFLSGHQGALARNALQNLGVTHILNVMDTCRVSDDDICLRVHIPISDYGDSDLLSAIKNCCHFIEQARETGGKVLLHCGRGQNRSPTVATAYLMLCQGMTLRQAFTHVRDRRPEFAPHESYLKQLQQCEQALFGCVTLTEDDGPLSIQEIVRRITRDTPDDIL